MTDSSGPAHQVHMYMAVARATERTAYPAGELHPVLVLRRQPRGAEHDLSAAHEVALRAGWEDVDFTKAGVLPADAEREMEDTFRARYREALERGESLLAYDAVVRPAPRK